MCHEGMSPSSRGRCVLAILLEGPPGVDPGDLSTQAAVSNQPMTRPRGRSERPIMQHFAGACPQRMTHLRSIRGAVRYSATEPQNHLDAPRREE